MSILQYPNGPNDVQIWNNAAFDSHAHYPNKPISIINSIDSLESFSSKENQSISSLGFNSSVSTINYSVSSDNSQGPLKPNNPNCVLEISKANSKTGNEVRVEKDIDNEIEEIEMEINRLTSRLEALRILKAQKSVKVTEKRGKIVSSKFMEHNQKPSKKMEQSVSKPKLDRRGRSLGPVEISAMKSKQFGKQDSSITPVQPIQNRRKSCFWKLEDIDEINETRGKGKVEMIRQAVTTIGSKKYVKKDDGVISSVQPKKLFGNGEKSVLPCSANKPMRQGRVVASRYSQISNQPASAIRKRSLPDNDKDESKRCEKKRSGNFEEKKNVDTPSRIKKRWEIPSEIVIHGNYDVEEKEEEEDSPKSVYVMDHMLPKLRVRRCTKESPRDSGPAKKVAELIGRKTFFSSDEEIEEVAICQALSFADE